MPYNCELTTENRDLYENRIIQLVMIFFSCYSQVVADCIITRMYEYLIAMQYINTNKEVHQKVALKSIKLTEDGRSLVNLMRIIRNYDVHSPSRLTESLYKRFKESITQDSIKDVAGFYLCPDKIIDFLQYQANSLNSQPKKISL